VSKLTKSARAQNCTFEIPGVCNANNETTVLCHLPHGKSGGVAYKTPDVLGAFGCSSCHDVIDGRATMPEHFKEDREFFMRRANGRTLLYWIDIGLINEN
jgi:hypothetical protein